MTGKRCSELVATDRVRRFYDGLWTRYAQDYDSCVEHVELFFEDAEIEGKRILDAGCGMGVFSAVLARKGAAGVIGIDLSEEGIRRACKLAEHLRLPNAGFAQGNILTLPFPDRSFDIVWSWGTVHHTADPRKALRELIRVLKDDGTLFVTLYHRTKLSFVHDATRKAMRLAPPRTWRFLARLLALALYPVTRLLKRRNKVRAGESLSDLALDWYFNPVRHYFRPEEIRELLEQEGFVIERFLPASGRFNSTSNFIFKARLAREPRFRSAKKNAAPPENRNRRGGCP